jgi:hypothetical protein
MKAALAVFVLATLIAPPQWQQCHYNARGLLVCRNCWIERGLHRCTGPRIEHRERVT